MKKAPQGGFPSNRAGYVLVDATRSSQELSMWDLDYTSQAEEIHALLADPEFQALMNEPSDEELEAMADWYEVLIPSKQGSNSNTTRSGARQ